MKTRKGKEAFISYYQELFPQKEEFANFIESMTQKSRPILLTPVQQQAKLKGVWQDKGLSLRTLAWCDDAILWPDEVAFGEKLPGFDEHLFYPMSASSLLPVMALKLQSTDQVLDACAAPGGKTLYMSTFLRFASQIVANDLSYSRLQRMRRVFRDFDIDDTRSTCKPAEKIWQEFPDHFDKILVDAPCSSEQHVWNSPEHLKQWSAKRPEKLAKRQIVLVETLLRALKPGGRLVYSTCAITPAENEAVVDTVLTNNPQISLKSFDYPLNGSALNIKSTHDLSALNRLMPHRDQMDPMFIAILEKNS